MINHGLTVAPRVNVTSCLSRLCHISGTAHTPILAVILLLVALFVFLLLVYPVACIGSISSVCRILIQSDVNSAASPNLEEASHELV
eukprot:SAG31_NODE_15290_length_762_cov_1.052790_1_plen_86_part_10